MSAQMKMLLCLRRNSPILFAEVRGDLEGAHPWCHLPFSVFGGPSRAADVSVHFSLSLYCKNEPFSYV